MTIVNKKAKLQDLNGRTGHRARSREKEHLYRYRAYFEGNLLRLVRALAHVHALMTRISCAQ